MDQEFTDFANTAGGAEPLLERMKRDIVSSQFRRGEWLRLADLEQRYGATRTEVRKALAALAAMRTLEHVANYGYRVQVIDGKLEQDSRLARFVLECAGADLIVQRITAADIEDLRALADAFQDRVENGTLTEIDDANHAFHRQMIGLCGNGVISDLVNDLRDRVRPSVRTPWSTHKGILESATEHFQMVDAIAAGDADLLKALLRKHMFKWS